jgi:hypothetical protein
VLPCTNHIPEKRPSIVWVIAALRSYFRRILQRVRKSLTPEKLNDIECMFVAREILLPFLFISQATLVLELQ